MKEFSIISTGKFETENFKACKAILADQRIPFSELIDGKGAMTLSRGKINPSGGFVIVTFNEEILLDYFDLVKWIETKGVRLI